MITEESAQYHQWYNDVSAVKKMALDGVGTLCPTCCTPFDKGKHRKLIDSCGHELCYMCINSDHCPLCVYHAQSQSHQRFSPEPVIPRPRLKTNGHFTPYMQTRERASPERPVGNLPPKVAAKPAVPEKTMCGQSPRASRPSRNFRHMKWPNVLQHDNQAALSDDELHVHSKLSSRDNDLYTRLGLLFGDRGVPQKHPSPFQQDSYASISSLASSEANTSPLSTLTISDSSDLDPPVSNLQTGGSDSVVSLMSLASSSAANSSSCGSTPLGTAHFQRHTPARTSDSFVQLAARRNFNRRQLQSKNDESVLSLTALGRRCSTAKILNKSLKPLYFEVPQSESEPLFFGRQWLFKEIEQELTSGSKGNRAIVIMGGPGSGKTAIVSQLVESSSFRIKKEDAIYHDIQSLDGSDYNMSNSSSSDSGLYQSISTLAHSGARALGHRVVAYHVCQTDNQVTCLVPEFVHSVAAHLCRAPQLTAYRDLVAKDHRLQNLLSLQSCISDADSAFLRGVLEPLTTLRKRNRIPNTTCLVVVDGLNEGEYHKPDYGDTILSFLIRHFEAIPSWMKLVLTVRTSHGERMKKLPSHVISLDRVSTSEHLQKDLCSYVLHRINTSCAIRANITVNNSKVEGTCTSRFASHLANLSKGCILYVRLTLDLIEKGHLVVKSSSYRVLPVSLSEVYMLNFNLKFTTIKSYERVTPLLQICLSSLRPLTPDELFRTLNARCLAEPVTWEDFLSRLEVLSSSHFVVARQDGRLAFVHPSMREWLLRREEGDGSKFLCDPRPGHAAIAFRLSRSERQKTADDCLEFGHHVLMAHLYKSSPREGLPHPRDLQAYWVSLGSECVQTSLGSLRNLHSPNVKVSRLLLLAGADPRHRVPHLDNLSILGVAAEHGFRDMVSLLLEFGADVTALADTGIGALALCCKKGHLEVARLLVANGSKINQIDNEGKCPLVHASSNGHLGVVSFLLQCDWTADPDNGPALPQAAQSSLVAASYNGYHNVAEHLLDLPFVQPNALDPLTGHSALTAASRGGHLQCCNALIRRGASVGGANKRKETSLLCACAEGHWEVAEKLLLHGAEPDQPDGQGRTPLMAAAMGGHPVLELLLSKGASVDAVDREGLSAVSWGCMKGHYQSVQCLVSHNCDLHLPDASGRTPLDYAAANGDPEIVQLLLDSGAVVEHSDASGMRPLERAIACKNTAAIVRFLHKGAKLGSQTWALAQGNSEIVIILLNKLLEDATVLSKRGRLKDAALRYGYALKKFTPEIVVGVDRRFNQIKFQLLLGLSRCKRKLNDPHSAIEAAEQAVSLRPASFEGYYARGRAREALGQHESALSDVLEAIRISPQNLEAKRVLLRLKEHISSANSAEQRDTIGFSGPDLPLADDLGSTDTMDRLCSMTLNLVEDLNKMKIKERMQDSGCESIH